MVIGLAGLNFVKRIMENDLYEVISVLHRGDKTSVDLDGLFEPRYRYCTVSGQVSLLFLVRINFGQRGARMCTRVGSMHVTCCLVSSGTPIYWYQ